MENYKTILQIVPALNVGGVERGVVEISKFIIENNFRSVVISSGGRLSFSIEKSGAKHYTLDVHTKNPLKWKKVRKRIEEIMKEEKIDLIHATSRVPAWIVSPLSTKLKVPLITSVHGRFRKGQFLKKIYNSVLLRGDYIIAISKYVKNSIVSLYPTSEPKIKVIHRGVDKNLFDISNISALRIINQSKEMQVNDDLPVILMASRPTLWKGHMILIEALSRVKSKFQCIMIGASDGKEKFKNKLYKNIEKFNLGGKIRLTSQTNDIQAAYMLGDIIVMPSLDPEPFGRIIVEAQSLGKIVIGFNHGGASETISDGETGFLANPYDPISLAEKIDQALNLKKAERNRISKLAKKNVQINFTHLKMCLQTFKLYKKCISEHNINCRKIY